MNEISTNMTCTSDMSLQDDLVECLVSDASLSGDNLLNETVEEMEPDKTQGMDTDSASTEKKLNCQETLKNGVFLKMEQMFKILSTTSKCLPAIPMGTKENAFYVFNSERNQTRQADGKKSEFSDDCGA